MTAEPQVLHYQKDRPLNEVPAYTTGMQLRLGELQVYLALSATEFAVYFDSNLALHYDLEGRFVKTATPGEYWRRSLSGKVLHTRKPIDGLVRSIVTGDEAASVITAAHRRVTAVLNAVRDGTATVELARPDIGTARQQILPVLELVAGYDSLVAARDAEQFRAIYGRVAVLPPDQYNALVLQATEGCSYAGCTFCDLYRNVAFRRKSAEEFLQHLRAAVNFHGESLRARRSIFLGEANALAQPMSALKGIFHTINEHFELPSAAVPARWWLGSKTRFDGVSSFMDAFTNQSRTARDYSELRQAGLRRVYIGLESGDVGLLKWLKKPATVEAALRCVRMLKEADIVVGVIVLLGAGGQEFAEAHVRETVRVLNEMPLTHDDYIYFSPLHVYPGSQYNVQAMTDAIGPATRVEQLKQEQEIRQALRPDRRCGQPHLAHYELETFVY